MSEEASFVIDQAEAAVQETPEMGVWSIKGVARWLLATGLSEEKAIAFVLRNTKLEGSFCHQLRTAFVKKTYSSTTQKEAKRLLKKVSAENIGTGSAKTPLEVFSILGKAT